MATTYITIDSDRLDSICHHHYGFAHGAVEAVLAANIGLAAHGAYLPAGVEILLPDVVQTQTKRVINLWD